MSLSTNVSNLATRIATEVKAIRTLVNGNLADLSTLDTTAKNNLVAAINEIKGALDTAATDITSLETSVGTLSLLTTTDKTNLVAAINELQSEIGSIDVSAQIEAAAGNGLNYTGSALNVGTATGSGISVTADAIAVDRTTTDTWYDAAGAAATAQSNAETYADNKISDITTGSTTTWSSTKIDSEISAAVSALVDGAPALLDTLNELAAAIADDPSFATTITAAIAAKADDSAVVKLTGDQTIAGIKTFSSAPIVPDSAFAIAKITGLQDALDAKASAANVGDTTTNYVTVFEAGLV